MAKINLPNIGSEIKLIVQADKVGDHRLSDYEWYLDLYCSNNRIVTINKESAIQEDEDSFIVKLDTSNVGYGRLYATLYAKIPDGQFYDTIRDEVSSIYTGITIKRSKGLVLNVVSDSNSYPIMGGCLQFRLGIVCSTADLPEKTIQSVGPERIWLTKSNSYTETVKVMATGDWIVR